MFGAASILSGLSKRLTRLCNYELKVLNNVRLIHCSTTFNVRFKELVPATTTADKIAGSHDILFQNMRSAKNSSEVLNNINRHHSIMNTKHAVQALKTLFNLQKGVSSVMSNGEIVHSKDFRKLCDILKSQIRHLELNDLIDVMKCMGYLGVPSNSKIITLVLGLISKQVNDLSLQQIQFLDFIMKDMKITPLVSALKIALPIVFDANLQRKCDFDDVPLMSDLLCFVSKRKMVDSSDVLVKGLIDKREQLSVKDAQNIVFSMCESRVYSEHYQLLLHHALDIITDSLNKMDFYEMDSTLGKLCTKHMETDGDGAYYHEEFCNNFAKLVVERDFSFEQTVWILKKLIKFNHVHLGLLTHVAAKMEREPWSLEQTGATGLITVLTALSHADFKPPNWDRIKSLILKACQGLQDRPELPWLRLVLHLCILDCWSEEFLNKVFDSKFLSSFLARDSKLDQIQLMILDQVSATLAPWDTRPRAPHAVVAPIVQFNRANHTTFPLQSALEHGLGGKEYVQTGLFSTLGHFLDHVVVMRKGGYPVAINLTTGEAKERITVEDIQVPSDSKMIAVLFVPPSMCAANNERVRGLFRIQINSIEALGIAVAPILHPVWNTLPDFERIPYLMRAIREKLPDSQMTGVVTPV